MDIVQRPVPAAADALAAAGIHPVLARVFAARGVTAADELDADLARLPPFAAMKGIDAASARLADAIERGEKILIVADYDADGATACAVGRPRPEGARRQRRFHRSQPVRVRLRTHAGDRRAGGDAFAAPHRHRRQRHREPRRRRRGGSARHRGADHRPPPARGDAAAAGADRESEPAGMRISEQASRRRRRDVLRAARDAGGAARARRVRGARGAQSRRAARPRRARHRRRRRAARPRQSHAGRAGPRAHSRRARAAGTRGALLRRRARCAPRDRLRPGLRRGTAPQRRRSHGGHVDRHPLPARRNRHRRAAARRGARPLQPRAARRRGRDAGGRAEGARRPRALDAGARRRLHAVPVRRRLAPGRGRHRRVAPEGPLPPPDDRVRARRRAGEIKGSGRSIPGFHLRDALDLVDKRAPGLIAKFGGHAYAAGLSLAAADLPRFAALFEALAREQLSPRSCKRTLETDGALGARRARLRPRRRRCAPRSGARAFRRRSSTADSRSPTSAPSAASTPGWRSCGRAGRRERFGAILFNHVDPLPPAIRAVYRPEVNEWNGNAALELVIQHWEPA